MTTQNDRKRGRNPLRMVSDGNFNGFRSFQAILCPFGATKSHFWAGTQNCRKLVLWHLKTITRRAEIWWRWFQMSLSRHLGHFGQKLCYFGAHWSHFWPQNDTKWPEMTWTHWNCHLKPSSVDFCLSCGHFEWSHDQFTTILSLGPKLAKSSQKWPKKAPNDRN